MPAVPLEPDNTPSTSWFAVRVRYNGERIALRHLRERGYEEFAPSHKIESVWSDRKKQIEQFLLPGYVFCRFNPNRRLPILTTPGVLDVVSFGKLPVPIPDEEIERIRRMVASGLPVAPYPFVEVGQTVRIARGPLAGLDGVLVEFKGKCRLVVSVHLLKRSLSAEVDRSAVCMIRSKTLPASPEQQYHSGFSSGG